MHALEKAKASLETLQNTDETLQARLESFDEFKGDLQKVKK